MDASFLTLVYVGYNFLIDIGRLHGFYVCCLFSWILYFHYFVGCWSLTASDSMLLDSVIYKAKKIKNLFWTLLFVMVLAVLFCLRKMCSFDDVVELEK